MYFVHTDEDECGSADSNICDADANCTNTDGSYICACHDGFSGDGETCNGFPFLCYDLSTNYWELRS